MHFLTEGDIRARCPKPGCTLLLASGERLTPSASEYASGLRITISRCGEGGAGSPSSVAPGGSSSGSGPAQSAASCAMTWLDEKTQVPKTHSRIVLRGKLDSLLATVVLVRTQFDPKDRLPALLKECLGDVNAWIMQILAAEVSGGEVEIKNMGGMDMETLYAVSREPTRYLGMDHCMADASLGGNVAMVNWLRAKARETEIEALRCLPGESGICRALNRLSSALYVLMLLIMAAQKGKDVSLFRG